MSQAEVEELKRGLADLSSKLEELKKAVSEQAAEIQKLAQGLEALAKEVGRLGEVVGFAIEDTARAFLPSWLRARAGISVERLERRFFEVGGRVVEVDLYGEGEADGGRVVVLGEVKARIHGEDVRALYEKASKIPVDGSRLVLVAFGLYAHPSALEEGKRRGVLVVTPYAVSA